jgi:hypothetical protein
MVQDRQVPGDVRRSYCNRSRRRPAAATGRRRCDRTHVAHDHRGVLRLAAGTRRNTGRTGGAVHAECSPLRTGEGVRSGTHPDRGR